MKKKEEFVIRCETCGYKNVFAQPYPYHAGFSDQGFMYSDSGHFTLVWSVYDPALKPFFPWNEEAEQRFESSLKPDPEGGKWRFSNPARCLNCSNPISRPSSENIYYLIYPNSVLTDEGEYLLKEQLK